MVNQVEKSINGDVVAVEELDVEERLTKGDGTIAHDFSEDEMNQKDIYSGVAKANEVKKFDAVLNKLVLTENASKLYDGSKRIVLERRTEHRSCNLPPL